MEAWIVENPKSAAYMLYLSAIIVFVSLIALYYYTKSQEYLANIQRPRQPKPAASPGSKPPLVTEKNDSAVEEKDGFTIISN